MNRRRAIYGIALLGGVTGTVGFNWYHKKYPTLDSLESLHPLLTELAETIIPATDTPGARDAQVADYIIKMVRDCTEHAAQNKFLAGLYDIDAYCYDHFGLPFINCNAAERIKALKYFEKDGTLWPGVLGKAQQKFLGAPFFATLKKYTVQGYCTSQLGATRALAYDYIPGKYQGCVQYEPKQKSWATN